MARHLAICERKSAYPSRTDAQTATVTHSMLDVLGLVRRPEEKPKPQKSKKMKKEVSFDKVDQVIPEASLTKPTTEEQKKDAEDTTKSKNVVKTNENVILDKDTSKNEVQIIDEDNKMDEGVANETAVVQNDTAVEDKEEKMEVDNEEVRETIATDKELTETKNEETVDKEKEAAIIDDRRDNDTDHKENEEISSNKDNIDEEKVKDNLDENKETHEEIEAEDKEPSQSKDLEDLSNKTDFKSPEQQTEDLEDAKKKTRNTRSYER